jgi:hypothetical protein
MGIAYRLQGRYFSGKLGYITPIEKTYVTDIEIVDKDVYYKGDRIEALPVPDYATIYKFKYNSMNPDIAIVDENTGIITSVLASGTATIEVLDEYTDTSRQFELTMINEKVIDLTPYLLIGGRPQAGNNRNGQTYYINNDSTQCYMPAGVFDVTPYASIEFPILAWWVSGGESQYDSKVILFLDDSSKIVEGYTYRELFSNYSTGIWNYNEEPLVLEVPEGASFLCVNTPLVGDEVFRTPIIKVFPKRYVPLVGITIQVPSLINGRGKAIASFDPSDAIDKEIIWSIESGSSYAEINQNGEIRVNEDVVSQPITIRATSSLHSSIYAEANTIVESATIIEHDYIECTTKGAWIAVDGFEQYGGKVTLICTRPTNPNTYAFSAPNSNTANNMRFACYSRLGKYGYNFGSIGFGDMNSSWPASSKAKYVYELSPDASTDGTLSVFNGTNLDNLVGTKKGKAWLNADLVFFVFMVCFNGPGSGFVKPDDANLATCKIYSCKVEDADGAIVRDIVAAEDASGVPCLYDKVTKQLFYNRGSGVLVVGDE